MPRDRYSGGRPRQEKLISQNAVYALRADAPSYVAKYTKAEIDKINKRYALIANKRLARLEKAGLTTSSAAYRFIRKASYSGFDFTTANNRFKTSSNRMDYEDAVEMLYQLHQFLFRTKTSTVSGTKEVNKNKVNEAYKALEEKHQGLLEKVNNYAEREGLNEDQKDDRIASFFNDATVQAIKDLYGSEYIDLIIDSVMQQCHLSEDAALDIIGKFLASTSNYPALPFDFISQVCNFYDRYKKSTLEDDAKDSATLEGYMVRNMDNLTYEGFDI